MIECTSPWIIVGGRRRLGRAVAQGLAGERALVLTSSTAWDGEAWATRHRTLVWDARDPDLVSTMEKDLRDQTLGGAVLLAGDFPEQPLGAWTRDGLARCWDLNLAFPMLAAQAIAPRLEAGACLQLVLDAAIHRPYSKRLPYSAAKSGLAALVPGLARLLAPRARVVGHAIGTLLPAVGMDPVALARQGLLERNGTPEDLLRAIRFAAASPYLTGEILTQDGGRRWA